MDSELDDILDLEELDKKINIDRIYNKIHRISKIDDTKIRKVNNRPIFKIYKRNKKMNRKKWLVPTKSH